MTISKEPLMVRKMTEEEKQKMELEAAKARMRREYDYSSITRSTQKLTSRKSSWDK